MLLSKPHIVLLRFIYCTR